MLRSDVTAQQCRAKEEEGRRTTAKLRGTVRLTPLHSYRESVHVHFPFYLHYSTLGYLPKVPSPKFFVLNSTQVW